MPGAPLPDPGTEAPVRLIADFDNLTLSHADRSRVVADRDRPRLMTPNGIIPGTLLVDGFVAGTWRLDTARATTTVTITPWSRQTRADLDAARAEAYRLLEAAVPEGAGHDVRVVTPQS